jgi:hypothetical protein
MESKCGTINLQLNMKDTAEYLFLEYFFYTGKLNQSNRERAQGLVANLLLSHIQKKPSFRPRSNSNNRLPRDTVADMVRAFCKSYLPHGYESWKLREKQWEGTPLSVNRSVSTNFSSGRPRSKSMVNEKKSNSSFGSKFDLFGKKLSRK